MLTVERAGVCPDPGNRRNQEMCYDVEKIYGWSDRLAYRTCLVFRVSCSLIRMTVCYE